MTDPAPSPCRSWGRRVQAWFDGEVSELEAGEIRAHLLDCSACRRAVGLWRSLREDLSLLQPEPVEPEVFEALAERFVASLAEEVHAFSRALQIWKTAAAVLLLAGAGLLAADRLLFPGVVQAHRPSEVDRAVERLLRERRQAAPPASEGAGPGAAAGEDRPEDEPGGRDGEPPAPGEDRAGEEGSR